VTGCSWVTVEALLDYQVSDTPRAGVTNGWRRGFDQLCAHARHAYDRIIGLDLSEVAIDGSLHKAHVVEKEPVPTPLTRGNWMAVVDRHRCQRDPHRVGLSTEPTATT